MSCVRGICGCAHRHVFGLYNRLPPKSSLIGCLGSPANSCNGLYDFTCTWTHHTEFIIKLEQVTHVLPVLPNTLFRQTGSDQFTLHSDEQEGQSVRNKMLTMIWWQQVNDFVNWLWFPPRFRSGGTGDQHILRLSIWDWLCSATTKNTLKTNSRPISR